MFPATQPTPFCVQWPTTWGIFAAYFSTAGLCRLAFPGDKPPKLLEASLPPMNAEWLSLTQQAVEKVLSGRAPNELPPLDLSRGTPFQQKVWALLRMIPFGETRTYGQVAAALGQPLAARAVGAACGANPVPVIVPCHRVLASNGKLGGYSAGLDWKRKLLAAEKPLGH
jgi:O-6-methylguanine DNA methyltransferase